MESPGNTVYHGESFLTDWFPREGNGFILRGEVVDFEAATAMSVKVEIFTKNTEDPGDGTTLTSLTMQTDALPLSGSIQQVLLEPSGSGVKELVRLKVTTPLGANGDWMLVRTFPLTWYDGV